jgi:hypothetical protein
MANLLFALMDASYDSLLEVLFFLSLEECTSLGFVCKDFQNVISDENIWRFHCYFRLPAFISYQLNLRFRIMNQLKELLDVPNYRHFFSVFRKLGFNLLGWLRRTSLIQGSHPNLGGLYFICLAGNRLYIGKLGAQLDEDFRAMLVYEPTIRKIMFISPSGDSINLKLLEDRLQLSDASGVPCMELRPLPPRVPSHSDGCDDSSSCCPCQVADELSNCFGLFTAPYGSHGTEILHLSLHSSSALRHVELDFGRLQLQGLKVTGDPNVPAAQLSFCINLQSRLDIDQALAIDDRPVVMFRTVRGTPDIISLQQRRRYAILWARGFGQINRQPSEWNPEWVGCGFILYKDALPDSEARFTIVWDDESHFFRHAMDFKALGIDHIVTTLSES